MKYIFSCILVVTTSLAYNQDIEVIINSSIKQMYYFTVYESNAEKRIRFDTLIFSPKHLTDENEIKRYNSLAYRLINGDFNQFEIGDIASDSFSNSFIKEVINLNFDKHILNYNEKIEPFILVLHDNNKPSIIKDLSVGIHKKLKKEIDNCSDKTLDAKLVQIVNNDFSFEDDHKYRLNITFFNTNGRSNSISLIGNDKYIFEFNSSNEVLPSYKTQKALSSILPDIDGNLISSLDGCPLTDILTSLVKSVCN